MTSDTHTKSRTNVGLAGHSCASHYVKQLDFYLLSELSPGELDKWIDDYLANLPIIPERDADDQCHI
jgi:hypothetical protein